MNWKTPLQSEKSRDNIEPLVNININKRKKYCTIKINKTKKLKV